MFTLLFHKDVFMPKGLEENAKVFQKNFRGFRLSTHIKNNVLYVDDRSHNYLEQKIIECLNTLQDTQYDAFEIEIAKDYYVFGNSKFHITKYCIRIPYSDTQDLAISIRPMFDAQTKKYNWENNLIVTAWLNAKTDSHTTLDSGKYVTEQRWQEIVTQAKKKVCRV